MGRLTTHVLDIAHGKPGSGMALTLYRRVGDRFEQLGSAVTNADGRCDAPLLEGDALKKGRYRLVFSAAAYFRACGPRISAWFEPQSAGGASATIAVRPSGPPAT